MGYFKSRLAHNAIELTATQHAGLNRYNTSNAEHDQDFHVLVDVSHFLPAKSGEIKFTETYQGGQIAIDTNANENSTLRYTGSGRYAGGWNRSPTWTIFFCSDFSSQPDAVRTFRYSYSSVKTPTVSPSLGNAT